MIPPFFWYFKMLYNLSTKPLRARTKETAKIESYLILSKRKHNTFVFVYLAVFFVQIVIQLINLQGTPKNLLLDDCLLSFNKIYFSVCQYAGD